MKQGKLLRSYLGTFPKARILAAIVKGRARNNKELSEHTLISFPWVISIIMLLYFLLSHKAVDWDDDMNTQSNNNALQSSSSSSSSYIRIEERGTKIQHLGRVKVPRLRCIPNTHKVVSRVPTIRFVRRISFLHNQTLVVRLVVVCSTETYD